MTYDPWVGVYQKIENAGQRYARMCAAVQPPRLTGAHAAAQASGAIIGHDWQRSLYPEVEAFLSVTRSIAEIAHCCFGADLANREMKDWFDKLPPAEQASRHAFTKQFKPLLDRFRALPLSAARQTSDHRTGIPPVEVECKGPFTTHRGNAAVRLPHAVTRGINDEHSWMDTPIPIQPLPKDFTIGGKPLFDECRAYLEAASILITDARAIAARVHQGIKLTAPPT